jgi:hypothetical protein
MYIHYYYKCSNIYIYNTKYSDIYILIYYTMYILLYKRIFTMVQDMGLGSSMPAWCKWQMGGSENSVPLNPMVNDHYPY